MPIECHTLNKAASKQFSFELAPKHDCVLVSVDDVTHTYTHIHTSTWTRERRRIEMKAKVAFDPQPKVSQKSKLSKESKTAKERNRATRCAAVESLFARNCKLHLYVCVNTMPIAAHTCKEIHSFA